MKRRILVIAVSAMMVLGMMGGPAMADASDNANCLAQARSEQQGELNRDAARAFAQALGQNENSQGVGAWMSTAGQTDCPG